jgi:predicted small lipoprotein YifL
MEILRKRIYIFVLVFTLLCLAACGKSGAAESNLTGTPDEILAALNESIKASGAEAPATMPPLSLNAETAPKNAGLSAESFAEYVTAAATEAAAISTFAHQVVVIQAKDSASATEVKALVSGEGGFDPNKWICVQPEKVLAVESGSYVLLVAARADYCDAALAAFTGLAGSIGEVNVFFEAA